MPLLPSLALSVNCFLFCQVLSPLSSGLFAVKPYTCCQLLSLLSSVVLAAKCCFYCEVVPLLSSAALAVKRCSCCQVIPLLSSDVLVVSSAVAGKQALTWYKFTKNVMQSTERNLPTRSCFLIRLFNSLLNSLSLIYYAFFSNKILLARNRISIAYICPERVASKYSYSTKKKLYDS